MITAVYRLACPRDEVRARARAIAIEQTVEVPDALVDEAVIGQVESVDPAPGGFDVRIAYRTDLADGQLPQLLNLLYGNVSMHDFVRLVDLELPADLLARFPGPAWGSERLREHLGVHGRPLLATALKPRGLPPAAYARLAGEFARGGGDLVKDDHNLAGGFEERVKRCAEAVAKANGETGRRCLYLPFLCAPAERIEEQVRFAMREGVQGILVPPLIVGLDVVRSLSERHGLLVMSHPTFSGGLIHNPRHGIEPGLLLGTLFRLAGADVSVFVNAGGRFHYSFQECSSIARRLREPLGNLKPGLPAPAGGMDVDRIEDMARRFGEEAVFLVGGALLTRGPTVREATAEYLARIRACFA